MVWAKKPVKNENNPENVVCIMQNGYLLHEFVRVNSS